MLRSFCFFFVVCFFTTGFCEEHKTVCLNMIVKNEKDVISRCLESVLPIIDTWVIVDTGSQDGTQQIIQDFFTQKGVPGKLYERPWKDFGHNRNEALFLAKDTADYILFMDADDTLSFSKEFILPNLIEDFYATASRDGKRECTLPRLVKASLDWKWEGVIHEYLIASSDAKGKMLENVEYVYKHDGARGKDPNTLNSDLALLLADPTPRNLFYALLSYQQLGRWAEALDICKKRILLGGSDEEVFTAYLVKGKMEDLLKKDSKESFLKAYFLRPHRLEPLYYLGKKLWEEGAYTSGYELIHTAIQLPRQEEDMLFIETWIYDSGLLLQYILFSAMTGHYAEGIKAVEELFARKNAQEADKKAAAECRRYIQDQVTQEIQKKLQSYISASGA